MFPAKVSRVVISSATGYRTENQISAILTNTMICLYFSPVPYTTGKSLWDSAAIVAQCLIPGLLPACFLFQVLNYDLIRKENKRIVNITGKDGNMFVRFYDFVGKNITFNILSFKSDNTTEHKLISTTLYGYNRKFFAEHLKSAGFTKIKYMGDFAGTPFSVKSSKDLIVLAVK